MSFNKNEILLTATAEEYNIIDMQKRLVSISDNLKKYFGLKEIDVRFLRDVMWRLQGIHRVTSLQDQCVAELEEFLREKQGNSGQLEWM